MEMLQGKNWVYQKVRFSTPEGEAKHDESVLKLIYSPKLFKRIRGCGFSGLTFLLGDGEAPSTTPLYRLDVGAFISYYTDN